MNISMIMALLQRVFLTVLTVFALTGADTGALAQTFVPEPGEFVVPPMSVVDRHGYDLVNGNVQYNIFSLEAAPDPLLSTPLNLGFGFLSENTDYVLKRFGQKARVTTPVGIYLFSYNQISQTWTAQNTSDTLVENSSGTQFTFTNASGTKYVYGRPVGVSAVQLCNAPIPVSGSAPTCLLPLLESQNTSGYSQYFSYEGNNISWMWRIKSIRTNTGYEMVKSYHYNGTSLSYAGVPGGIYTQADENYRNWKLFHNINYINAATSGLSQITVSNSIPYEMSMEGQYFNVTLPDGAVVSGHILPDDFNQQSLVVEKGGIVKSATVAGNYSPGLTNLHSVDSPENSQYQVQFGVSSPTITVTSFGEDGSQFVVESAPYAPGSFDYDGFTAPQRVVDRNGRTTLYEWKDPKHLDLVTLPNGSKVDYQYDLRGNLSAIYRRSPDGIEQIREFFAVYPEYCVAASNCNKPLYTEDANGGRTDTEYSAVHGNIIRITYPAGMDGVRPETRYTYNQLYAWAKSGGGYTQEARPIWVVTSEEFCKSSAADTNGNCAAGTSDKVTSTYQYQEGTPTKGSNLLLLGKSVSTGGTTVRTCYQYDSYARRVAETKPKANLGVCP